MSEQNIQPLIDCHIHIMGRASLQNVTDAFHVCGFDAMNVLSIPRSDEKLAHNMLGLFFKTLLPDRVYVFGALRHPEYGEIKEPLSYLEQAKLLADLGCDGFKLLEGKPTVRKTLGRALDDPCYDEFYSFLEETSTPLLFHVADPETFWDHRLAPAFAHRQGWFYGDGSYPEKEQLYTEAENVLIKHPELRVVFAHFYFLSADLERLSTFFDRYPSVSVDITPGSEMYANFSGQHQRARQFFIEYADRILFGTDIIGGTEPEPDFGRKMKRKKTDVMLRFLRSDDEFTAWDGMNLKGLSLPDPALQAVCAGNFRRWAGDRPQPPDKTAALQVWPTRRENRL